MFSVWTLKTPKEAKANWNEAETETKLDDDDDKLGRINAFVACEAILFNLKQNSGCLNWKFCTTESFLGG